MLTPILSTVSFTIQHNDWSAYDNAVDLCDKMITMLCRFTTLRTLIIDYQYDKADISTKKHLAASLIHHAQNLESLRLKFGCILERRAGGLRPNEDIVKAMKKCTRLREVAFVLWHDRDPVIKDSPVDLSGLSTTTADPRVCC